MNSETIKIETIKVKDLHSFVLNYSANKSKDEIDVITRQRAYAQSKNPYASDDDTGLILAFKNDKCIGYLGLMPGIVRIGGLDEKIIWPTCMYISPEARGQSISTLLINTALRTNKALVITGMGRMSEPVFLHLKFKPIRKAEFSEVNFQILNRRPISTIDEVIRKIIVPHSKKGTGRKFNGGIIYKLLKKWAYKIIIENNKVDYKNIVIEEISLLDETFRSRVPIAHNSFPRTLEWINWMLQYRWVLGKDETEQVESNYYFSNTRDYFKYVTLKVLSLGTEKKEGFLIFSVSKDKSFTRIKLLDHTCENEEDGRHVVAIILRYAQNIYADSIEISSDVIYFFNPGIFKKVLLLQREWRYIFLMSDMSSQIAKNLEEVNPRSYDGDIAFV